ncbi:MAG: GDP-mannose 4,6-dehydratase [Candidatus Binatia bacterium]
MQLTDKRILITGAGGFVGSHLTERLVGLGNEVMCFIRYNSRSDTGLLELLPSSIRREIRIIAGDLRDADAIRGAVQGKDVVFHLGALVGIPYSYVHPREVVATNLLGTLNILTAAREAGTEKVVHTSTSEVYGTAQYVPMDEEHPLQGQSPYSASKIGADKLAESFFLTYELPVTTIRPFNIYGPRQSARAVIPTIISQVLTKREVSVGAVTPTRDFTYVTDIVEAFTRIAESPEATGKVINIGSNFEISIAELATTIAKLVGKDIELVQDEKRLRPSRSEVGRLCADNTLAKEVLGWEPTVPLEEGLRMTIAWMSEHMEAIDPHAYYF